VLNKQNSENFKVSEKNKNKNWCPFSQRCQDAYVVSSPFKYRRGETSYIINKDLPD